MSEHPRNDDELEVFLEGGSTLSRRYKEASEEHPPAKVDAAILAAAQWAVGADPGQGSKRSATGRRGPAAHADSNLWRHLFSRWGVPLATAAVVVIAATLTLMIERDPELERIERQVRQSDSIALNAPDQRSGDMPGESVEQRDDAVAKRSAATASPDKPATDKSSLDESGQVKSESVKPAPRRLEFRPVDEEAAAAAKEFAARQKAPAASGRTEAPPMDVAPPLAQQRPVDEKRVVPAERPGDSDAVLIRDMPSGETTPDQSTAAATDSAGAFSPAPVTGLAGAQRDAAEPAGEIASPQTGSAQPATGAAPPPTQFVPAQSVPTSPATEGNARPAARDPEDWIADIEEQLALGNRELARAALRNFRDRYPDYKLPEALEELLPVSEP